MDEKIKDLIKVKLRELKDEKKKKDDACEDLLIQLENIQNDLSDRSRDYDMKIFELNNELIELGKVYSDSLKTNDGELKYRRGYDRVTYKSKEIDKICDDNKRIRDLLYPYRNVSEVSPTVSIVTF